MDDITREYVTFQVTNKEGQLIELAVVDEFEFEKKNYVAGALIEGDEIQEDGLYIYEASVKDGELQAEKISNSKDYERIAKAYLEMAD